MSGAADPGLRRQRHLDALHNLVFKLEAFCGLMDTEPDVPLSPAGNMGLWLIMTEVRDTIRRAAEGLQGLQRRQ